MTYFLLHCIIKDIDLPCLFYVKHDVALHSSACVWLISYDHLCYAVSSPSAVTWPQLSSCWSARGCSVPGSPHSQPLECGAGQSDTGAIVTNTRAGDNCQHGHQGNATQAAAAGHIITFHHGKNAELCKRICNSVICIFARRCISQFIQIEVEGL